jgi:murein DD-endopeptidase MepM/ murein hydrolase activator NlpD
MLAGMKYSIKKIGYMYLISSTIVTLSMRTDPLIAKSIHSITLKDLNISNNQIKSLRRDIRKTIFTTKSRRDPQDLPELKFYRYRVRKGENFWKILSKTSQNIDTLITINSLSTPSDIHPGKIIYIPNMRGIIFENRNLDSIEKISRKFKLNKRYINKVNNIENQTKKYLFIPNAEISNLERSLFLGTGFASPLKRGKRTSIFGNRIDPIDKTIKFHTGIDIACPLGSKVYASRSGEVIFTGFRGNYGLLVVLKHKYSYHSYYGHLSRIKTKMGAFVKRGEIIALSGNSGRTTGPHLHFEVRKKSRAINPGILLR